MARILARPWLGFLGVLVLCACGTRPAGPPGPVTPHVLEQADRAARAALADRHLPGLAVVIARGDEVVLARGYGAADMERGGAVTADTVFQLGSISKQFLAALVVGLVDDGRLALDDPVTQHLADFPQLPPTLRVRHLLNHTSGLRELFTAPEAQQAFDDLTRTRGDLAAFVRRLPLDAAPGARWSYSNTNYTLLALLVEHLTGAPYEEGLRARLLAPLGLSSIRHCTPLPARPEDARGHEWRDGRVVVAAPENIEWARGDGGLCGSARDVARWLRLLAMGRVVSPAAFAAMTTVTRVADRPDADYGFGVSLVPLEGVRKLAHNGAMRGFSASAAYYPDPELTVVLLTNRGDVRTESLETTVDLAGGGAPGATDARPAGAGARCPPARRRRAPAVRGRLRHRRVRGPDRGAGGPALGRDAAAGTGNGTPVPG
jgi:D-alanyl-D-alanine carboxypeptidase